MPVACFDLDGCLDSYVSTFVPLLGAMKKAGNWHIVVLTGDEQDTVTAENIAQKQDYLAELGYGALYDEVTIVAKPTASNKALYIADNHVVLFVDNRSKNLKAALDAAPGCLCLLPWATRE